MFSRFLFICILVLFAQQAYVQTGKTSATGPSTATPIYYSQWGPLKSGIHTAVQVGAIVPAAIVVKDQLGTVYSVFSFRINYKFKSTYKDGETQEMKSIWDLRVSEFNQTAQLSKPWVESIKDNIKAGDTILINKIIFKNASGKTQLAPDLKIAVR